MAGDNTRASPRFPPPRSASEKSVYIVQRRDKAGGRHLVIESGIHDVLRCGDEGVGIEQARGCDPYNRGTMPRAARSERMPRHVSVMPSGARMSRLTISRKRRPLPSNLRTHSATNRVRHDLRITRLFSGHRKPQVWRTRQRRPPQDCLACLRAQLESRGATPAVWQRS